MPLQQSLQTSAQNKTALERTSRDYLFHLHHLNRLIQTQVIISRCFSNLLLKNVLLKKQVVSHNSLSHSLFVLLGRFSLMFKLKLYFCNLITCF